MYLTVDYFFVRGANLIDIFLLCTFQPELSCSYYPPRKFNKAIEVLQGDIEALENDKDTLKKQLDKQVRVTAGPEVPITRRSHTVVGEF